MPNTDIWLCVCHGMQAYLETDAKVPFWVCETDDKVCEVTMVDKDVQTWKLYDGTVEVEFRGGVRHTYKKDGKLITGVSSFVNVLAKPDLLNWAAYEAGEAFKAAVQPFTLAGASCTQAELKKLADAAKKAHLHKSDKGKDVGTIAHEWIKQETTEGIGKVHQPRYSLVLLTQAKNAEEEKIIKDNTNAAHHCVTLWRRWLNDYQVEIIKSERVVYSKKLNYAGTYDVWFYSGRLKKTFMGDYKTSEPRKIRNSKFVITGHSAYPEHFAQVAGYDYAHNEEFGEDPDGYALIYLPKTPKSDYHVFTNSDVTGGRKGWESLVNVYNWQKAVKKGKDV